MMEEYQIAERNQVFTVLKKYVEKHYIYAVWPLPWFGVWKERELWKNVDLNGDILHTYRAQAICPPFKSLEEARAKIKIWKKGTIYHKEQ